MFLTTLLTNVAPSFWLSSAYSHHDRAKQSRKYQQQTSITHPNSLQLMEPLGYCSLQCSLQCSLPEHAMICMHLRNLCLAVMRD